MNADFTIAAKYKSATDKSEIVSVIGNNVKNKTCINIDNIADSCETIVM
ncbi:MAG: hypothetical protein LBU35_02415 [Holosporales bacterium]|nr:hypothetical protein [Holosporales bacterium]